MAKGKYAARSALRREDAEVQTELEAGRRHIVRLTEQIRELEGKLAEERRARKEETGRLRAMLDENLSPEVITLRRALEEQRDKARRAEARIGHAERVESEILFNVSLLLEQGFGLSPMEAAEVILFLVNGTSESEPAITAGEKWGGIFTRIGMSRDSVLRIQASKGMRNRADVVGLLHSKFREITAGDQVSG